MSHSHWPQLASGRRLPRLGHEARTFCYACVSFRKQACPIEKSSTQHEGWVRQCAGERYQGRFIT